MVFLCIIRVVYQPGCVSLVCLMRLRVSFVDGCRSSIVRRHVFLYLLSSIMGRFSSYSIEVCSINWYSNVRPAASLNGWVHQEFGIVLYSWSTHLYSSVHVIYAYWCVTNDLSVVDESMKIRTSRSCWQLLQNTYLGSIPDIFQYSQPE